MWCPKCEYEHTKVAGTDKSYIVERYRKCPECGFGFMTIETIKNDPEWQELADYSDEEIALILKKRHKTNSKQKELFE